MSVRSLSMWAIDFGRLWLWLLLLAAALVVCAGCGTTGGAGNPSDIEDVRVTGSNNFTMVWQWFANQSGSVSQRDLAKDFVHDITPAARGAAAAVGAAVRDSMSGGAAAPPAGDASTAPEPAPPSPSPAPPPAGVIVESPLPPQAERFLFKPVGENSGKLVILTPARLNVQAVTFAGEDGAAPHDPANGYNHGRNGHNGNRQHWRFNKPGGAYPAGSVVLDIAGHGRLAVPIRNPGKRYEAGLAVEAMAAAEDEPEPAEVTPDAGPAETVDPEAPAAGPAGGGDAVRVWYEPPHLVLPAATDVVRVALHIDGRAAETGRSVPLRGNVAEVPAEWLGERALLAQCHTRTDEALYEITFDPRAGFLAPYSVIYTKGWMRWTAAVPQEGYQPTAEQAANRLSTKWRFEG